MSNPTDKYHVFRDPDDGSEIAVLEPAHDGTNVNVLVSVRLVDFVTVALLAGYEKVVPDGVA